MDCRVRRSQHEPALDAAEAILLPPIEIAVRYHPAFLPLFRATSYDAWTDAALIDEVLREAGLEE